MDSKQGTRQFDTGAVRGRTWFTYQLPAVYARIRLEHNGNSLLFIRLGISYNNNNNNKIRSLRNPYRRRVRTAEDALQLLGRPRGVGRVYNPARRHHRASVSVFVAVNHDNNIISSVPFSTGRKHNVKMNTKTVISHFIS